MAMCVSPSGASRTTDGPFVVIVQPAGAVNVAPAGVAFGEFLSMVSGAAVSAARARGRESVKIRIARTGRRVMAAPFGARLRGLIRSAPVGVYGAPTEC